MVQPFPIFNTCGLQSQPDGMKSGLLEQSSHRSGDLPNMQGIGRMKTYGQPHPNRPFQDRDGMMWRIDEKRIVIKHKIGNPMRHVPMANLLNYSLR